MAHRKVRAFTHSPVADGRERADGGPEDVANGVDAGVLPVARTLAAHPGRAPRPLGIIRLL